MSKSCPCHSGKLYADCCQPFHQGEKQITALQLMRSRYSAYALKLADYIMETTHPSNPGFMTDRKEWAKQIRQFGENTQFEGLQILHVEEGSEVSFVTFKALLKDASFTEKSRFEKIDGRWLYHTGSYAHISS